VQWFEFIPKGKLVSKYSRLSGMHNVRPHCRPLQTDRQSAV